MQNDGFQSHVADGVFCQFENCVFFNPVTFKFFVAAPKAAIAAVVAAEIGKLDQTAQMNAVADILPSDGVCRRKQFFVRFFAAAKQFDQFVFVERMLFARFFDQPVH